MANAKAEKLSISRRASPMIYTEERLDESAKETLKRRDQLTAEQNKKSPFLIGTIDDVSKKISNLDQKLQSYTALVIESRASDKSELESNAGSSSHAELEKENGHEKAVAETKEVNQFAGIYAMKSIQELKDAFFGKPNERVKNISKISMNPSKSSPPKDSGKPKFVELHQYSGFDEAECTPLPNGTTSVDILAKVAKAQTKLKSKKKYLPEFERLFFSPMTQGILKDMFWWLFVEKWQASKSSQPRLFHRISITYVKLLTSANHPTYREPFLKDFPSLMAQGVYAAYCDAFPDSYRQFNDDFKWDLTNMVFSWIAGISPAPRSWQSWNMSGLEPANIKQREELMNKAKKGKKVKGLNEQDFTQAGPQAPNSVMSASGSTMQPTPSVTSLGSKNTQRHSIAPSSKKKTAAGDTASKQDGKKDRSSAGKSKGKIGGTDIFPITEDGEDGVQQTEHVKSYNAIHKEKDKARESHPACKGPDFVRHVFNLNGQSPLVAHYLNTQNLANDAGQAVYIQHTRMENLPPLDAPTYRDIRHESYKKVQEIAKGHQLLVDKGMKKAITFDNKQRDMVVMYRKKERNLLSKTREVKRLSDLIMLELRKDEDSITAGAAQALELALDAQDD